MARPRFLDALQPAHRAEVEPLLREEVRAGRSLRDPVSGQSLGQEVQTLGRARVIRGESPQAQPPVPASLDILSAKQELRAGDQLLPVPPRQFVSYAPRAPETVVESGAIVSIYGSAVGMAGQNQVVAINKGTADGIASGHVLAIMKRGAVVTDRTEGRKENLKLPDERNGLLMVFRTFEKVSYALILQTSDGVRVGDRLANPR